MNNPFVVVPGEGRRVALGAFDVVLLATAERTGGAFTLMETIESAIGVGPPLHVHHDATESFYVVEGEYDFHVGDESRVCGAGSLVSIPKGVPHTFRNRVAPSRKLNLFTPAAMEGYFVDLAAALEHGIDEAGLDQIAQRYSMEILGPAPDGYL